MYRSVHMIRRLMLRWGSDYFLRGVVHGSVATLDDQPGFSDLDLTFVVRREVLINAKRLLQLRRLSARIIAWSFAFDPFMHHGPIYLTEVDLVRYPEGFFPVILYDYAVNLLTNAPVVKVWSYPARGILKHILASRNRQYSNYLSYDMRNIDRFELQWLLAGVTMLPVMYLQLKTGKCRYKRDVFDIVSQDFEQELWEPVEIASKLRMILPPKIRFPLILMWLLGRLERPGYIQRWARRRKSANIPQDKLKSLLGSGYVMKAKRLLDEIIKRTKISNKENMTNSCSFVKDTIFYGITESEEQSNGLADLCNGPFCDIPRRISISQYERVTQYLLERWIVLNPQPVSIYKIGSVGVPSISDLDFLLVYEEGAVNAWTSVNKFDLPSWVRELYMHEPIICNRNSWKVLPAWFPVFNFQLLDGEELEIPRIHESLLEGCSLGQAINFLMLKIPLDFITKASQKPIRLRSLLCTLNSMKHTFRLLEMAGIGLKEETLNVTKAIDKLRKCWFNLGMERYDYLSQVFLSAVEAGGEAIAMVDKHLNRLGIEEWLHDNQSNIMNPMYNEFHFMANWSLQDSLDMLYKNQFKRKYWVYPESFLAVLSFYIRAIPSLGPYLGNPKSWDGNRWAEGLHYQSEGIKAYIESAKCLGVPGFNHIVWGLPSDSLL